MINGFRRTAAAAVTVLALGAGTAAWATSSASAAPALHPECIYSYLAVWVNADSADGTAGTTYFHLDFTNTTHVTCYMSGWPKGVVATTLAGKQLGAAAVGNNDVPARPIVLVPGATAHSDLGYVDIVVDPTCKPKVASYLKVTPPSSPSSRRAFFALPVCTTSKPVDLTIGRVRAGI
jgi:Protein of unknown function (DUF4232)